MTDYEQKRDLVSLELSKTYVSSITSELESLVFYQDFIRMSDFGYNEGYTEGKEAAFMAVIEQIKKDSSLFGTMPESFRMFENWMKLNKDKIIGAP
jgi:hypothetical protein